MLGITRGLENTINIQYKLEAMLFFKKPFSLDANFMAFARNGPKHTMGIVYNSHLNFRFYVTLLKMTVCMSPYQNQFSDV